MSEKELAFVAGAIKELCILTCDDEPSILNLKNDMAACRSSKKCMSVEAPVRDSRAGGAECTFVDLSLIALRQTRIGSDITSRKRGRSETIQTSSPWTSWTIGGTDRFGHCESVEHPTVARE